MPDYTQTYLDTITKSQEVALNAATAWFDHVQATWDGVFAQAESEPQVPSPVDVVNSTFDSLERLLGLQREYYNGLAQAYAPLVDQVAADAKNATETFASKS